jgi:hypothetical protein
MARHILIILEHHLIILIAENQKGYAKRKIRCFGN